MEKTVLCTDCTTVACCKSEEERPEYCPILNIDPNALADMKEAYRENETNRIMHAASTVMSKRISSKLSRVQELIEFSHELGIKRIGLAYCIALKNETRALAQILNENGLEVYEALCKIGGMHLSEIGITEEDPTCDPVSCDPLTQAHALNEAQTDLNVLVGLCLGHDILFVRYSAAPCTTLIVKDIKYRHNPITELKLRGLS